MTKATEDSLIASRFLSISILTKCLLSDTFILLETTEITQVPVLVTSTRAVTFPSGGFQGLLLLFCRKDSISFCCCNECWV